MIIDVHHHLYKFFSDFFRSTSALLLMSLTFQFLHQSKMLKFFLVFSIVYSEVFAEKEKPFNLKFQQNDYKIKFEWGELVRYNKRYVKVFQQVAFKYNRTCTAINVTYEYKIDIDNHMEIVVQAYKFASNEFREFPLRLQVNFCVAVSKNLIGSQTMKCGNYTKCTTPKNVRVHICNWAPDPAQFPPFIPSGRYKLEFQGLYYNEEMFVSTVYGEVYRPFTGK